MKIDEWLPHYQVSARYSIEVNSSVEKTAAALARADFSSLPTVRGLMRLRGYRMSRSSPVEAGNAAPALSVLTTQTRRFGSFLELANVPQQEVVLGIAGRFWRPDGGIIHNLTPGQFRDFQRVGYAKAVWNFSISAAQEGSLLSTETRVRAFGRAAALKFRLYWLMVNPFSGLMRKAMLREVKRIAEQMPIEA